MQRRRPAGGEAFGTPLHAEQQLAHHREVAELEEDQGQERLPR
jgi:hypothetical protein